MWRHFVSQAFVACGLLALLAWAVWWEVPPQRVPAHVAMRNEIDVAQLVRRDDGVTEQQATMFALLDELFPYEVANQPFVKVSIGRQPWPTQTTSISNWPDRADDSFGLVSRHGFLLDDDGARFRVRFLDGERAELTKSPPDTPPRRRTDFEIVDLADHARRLATESDRGGETYGHPIGTDMLQLLALRALARTGRRAEMDELWQALPTELRSLKFPDPAQSWFVGELAARLALDFDDLSLSWADLLARHERALVVLPWRREVQERRDQLAAIVAQRGATKPAADFRSPTKDILRDVALPRTGGSWAGCWELARWEPLPPGTAAAITHLLQRGLDVVPELTALLDDESPTRSIYYYVGKGGLHLHVQDVRSQARAVLEVFHGGPGEIRADDMVRSMTAAEWRHWAERTRAIGLRRFLIEKMRGPDAELQAAGCYARLWPDDVVAVIDAAVAADDAVCLRMLWAALGASSPGDAARARTIECLHRIARERTGGERALAADMLLDLGDSFGVARLLDAWRRGEQMADRDRAVLVVSGLPEVWDAMLASLDAADVRQALASIVFHITHDGVVDRASEATRPLVDAALRRCLLRLLEDPTTPLGTERRDPFSYRPEPIRPHNASCADAAAMALASWWPAEFPFDGRLTTSLRQRQIDEILRRTGGRVPVRPARVAGAGENDIGPVQFGAGTGSLTPECAARIRAICSKPFEPSRLVADLEALWRWHDVAVTLHFERTGQGDGFSVLCEVRPIEAQRSPQFMGIETIAGVQRRLDSDHDLRPPTAKAVEMSFGRGL